jgi:uncharacterized membrane protein
MKITPGIQHARGLPSVAILFLLLTATISLLWSHQKLMSQDEFFVLQTDTVNSVSQLIQVQRATPTALDPLAYHLLAHAAVRVFGPSAFALRLPSLLGYLLMQVCLFVIVRRLAGERPGVFALAFPALTATLFYSAEARPYGLMLGLYALAFLCWQTATRRRSHRLLALVMLAVSVILCLNAHYFGILVLVPLCAAEIFRIVENRRIDFPVAVAILAGMAGILFTLPFQGAAKAFREHYYNVDMVNLRAISQAYRSLFLDYTAYSMREQRFIALGLVVLAFALIAGCIYCWKTRNIKAPAAEIVFILGLAALPVFGFLLARFVTHSIEVRYVNPAIIGIIILFALVLARSFERDRFYRLALIFMFAIAVEGGVLRIHAEAEKTRFIRSSLVASPELKAAILSSPSQLLYIQDIGHFEVASYYEPDPFIRSHMAVLYSSEEEMRWAGHDTLSRISVHMRAFTGFPIVSYDQLKQERGPHIMVLVHSGSGGWDWTDQALAADHAQMAPLGPLMDGDAVSVRFPQQTKTAH